MKLAKKVSAVLAAVMLLGCLSACGKNKTLTLFTWEAMFPQEVLEGFEKETGYKINYVNFDYDETMLAKLESAGGGDYDVIIADDYIIEQAIEKGLVAKLDKSRLPNFGNINPAFQGQFYDPQDEYTVPYGAGIIEIGYYPDKIGHEITGYKDLWAEDMRGRVGIIGNCRVINGIALKLLGCSFNTENEDEVRKAGELLQELAPNVRLINDMFLNEDLISGEVDAAIMYTSQATLAALADPAVKLVLPEEGLGYGIMGMFIASKAPNSEAAHAFVNYILGAETGARCFEFMGYYSTNQASDGFISEEMKPLITLPEDASEDREMIENISGELYDVHEEIWNEFKLSCS